MIDIICEKFQQLEYEYSLHAVDQSIRKRIRREEVEEAVANGQIIEDYPTDKYGPSCLIFGMTQLGDLFIFRTGAKIKIVTVYQPDPDEWIDFRIRRPE